MINIKRTKNRKIKDLRDLKRKSISPIISVVLLLVVAVIIVGSILSWGLSTTNNSLEKSQEIYKEDPTLTGYIYTSNTQPTNYIVKNLSNKDVTITKYEIIASQDSGVLNKPITLDQPINLNSGSMVSVPLICNPDKSFKVNLITSEGKYITVPINNINYQSNSCFNNSDIPDSVCLGITANGNGNTVDDPIVICSIEDLDNIRNELDKYYKLGRNLDLNVSPYNEGEGWKPIGSAENGFNGSFNGNNYTISNLYINRPTNDYIGLFGYSSGNLQQLYLINVNVVGQNLTSGIVGKNSGEIFSCSISGNIIGNNSVGGITGENTHPGVIEYSYSLANVSGNSNIGGLVGLNTKIIFNSYSIGDINGTYYVGGLVGKVGGSVQIPGQIVYSYTSTNVLSVGTTIGGFAGGHLDLGGFNPPAVVIYTSNFWDQNSSNSYLNSIGNKGELEGVFRSTSTEMITENNFTDWNFTDIWGIDEGQSYPYLLVNEQIPRPKPENN